MTKFPWTGDPLAYLATPYTKFPQGLSGAFVIAARLAARLLKAGVKVYSPICHAHPIAIHGGLGPRDHALWIPFDELMMARCDILIVAHMDGWAQSKGIAHEVEFFTNAGKPIFDLDTTTLTMARRPAVASTSAEIDWTLQTR